MRPRLRNAAGLLLLAASLLFPARVRAQDAAVEDNSMDERSAAHARLVSMEGKTAPDMSLVLRDGSERSLSEYQGRWVFLEFGYTACPYSEWVALALSQIKADLHDQAFEFIQVYTDPSWDDIELGTQFDFVGTQARPGPDGIPGDYNPGFVPACYLINPRGRIVWTCGYRPEARLRTALQEKIGSGLHFPDGFATVSLYREKQEEAIHDPIAKAEPIWRGLIAEKPDDLFNRLALAAGLKNKEMFEFLDPQLAALSEADTPARWHLLEARARRTAAFDPAAALPLYRPVAAKYPGSLRVRRGLLALETPPERFTEADLKLMEGATWAHADYFALAAAAYAFEDHGRPDDAANALQDFTGWTQIHPIGLQARQGHAGAALAAAQKLDGEATPANANRGQAWDLMWNHFAAQDWAGASRFAARHFELTPQNAGGLAVRLFCALRLHNDADRDEALGLLDKFKTDRAAYLFAQGVQHGENTMTAEALAPLAQDSHRTEAMVWAVAALEAAGKTDEAAAACTRALEGRSPLGVDYAVLFSLRAVLGKAAPLAAAAP